MDETQFPYLKEMTDADLVKLIGEYVKAPQWLIEQDGTFIKAVKDELKRRSGEKRLQLGEEQMMNRRTFLSSMMVAPLVTNLKIPDKPEPVFHGYLNVPMHQVWCRINNRFILPYIDGEVPRECIAADSINGWVDYYIIEEGRYVVGPDLDLVVERRYGKVEWRLAPWPPLHHYQ